MKSVATYRRIRVDTCPAARLAHKDGLAAPPKIALVESDILNAYALSSVAQQGPNGTVLVNPYVFVVHTELLAADHSETQLRGVFAHELGHLILRNNSPEVREELAKSYRVEGSEDGIFGQTRANEPEIAEHTTKILALQQRVGGVPELGYPAVVGCRYGNIVGLMIKRTPACANVAADIDALRQLQLAFLPKLALGDLTPRERSADEQAQLDALSTAIFDGLRACDDGEVMPMAALTATLNQLPAEAVDPAHPQHAQLDALLVDAERKVDAENPDATLIERLLKAEELVRTDLLQLRADPAFPIDELRYYDIEEDADGASVRVLGAIGDDPTGVLQFLLSIIPEDAAKSCVDKIRNDEPISYGQLRDQHPAICWRAYHIGQLALALDQCPAD